MNDMPDVWTHLQLRARNPGADVDTAAGPIPELVPPGTPPAAPPRIELNPALGADTDAILREAGYEAAAIENLHCAGAV